jgi:hypothetical protein
VRLQFSLLLPIFSLAALSLAAVPSAQAQNGNLTVPSTVQAGSAFSIQTSGSGKSVLYIVGPAQALKQDVQLGEAVSFPAGSLYNAGHYLAILAGTSSSGTGAFDCVPSSKPANLSFLAKPSRLAVGLQNGISGTVYVFDAYYNLITTPMPVSFDLSNPSGEKQARTLTTHQGVASVEMNSTTKEGIDKFEAQAGGVSSDRIVEQVPGDPCGLRMSAQPSGQLLQLKTDPVRDCSGNAVPDGTIVTFTENYNGTQSTVDVPLKRGIAQVEMPAHSGARISVASGVVMGNEIRWQR